MGATMHLDFDVVAGATHLDVPSRADLDRRGGNKVWS